ncbi:MAG TPA: hypothetical protein VFE50_14565 [Cyclobacteriaceae bacterium]|nr:hypothetical protein [Cyclobacteriaceae bacterium]
MKRGMISLVCLFVAGTVWAQPSAPSGFDANANLANASNSMFRSFDNRYTGVKGTSTVFDDFVYGNVNMKSGERAEGQELNYDVMTRELIVRSRIYKKILAVRYDLVNSFELIDANGDTLFFEKIADNKGFVQRVHSGKAKVYMKYQKQIARANHGGAYNSNARTYDEFEDVSVYLVSKNDEPLSEMKGSRKAVEAKFPEKKDFIKKYFKENKPDLKNPKEMSRFFAALEKAG